MSPQTEMITTNLDFDRVTQRSKAHELDRCPNQYAHFHEPGTTGWGYLDFGYGAADADTERGRELKLKDAHGVEVKSVEDDSPAAKAGLKEGDVVLAFNGDRVEGSAQFIRMVRETPAGREVKLLISRGGQTQTIEATTGTRKPRVFRWKGSSDFFGHGGHESPEASDDEDEDANGPEPPDAPESPEWSEGPDFEEFDIPDVDMNEIVIPEIHVPDLPRALLSWRSPRLGIETESLGSQLAEFFGVKEGVLVRSVIKGSAAERAGIKAGDVIIKVDATKVSAPGEITSTLRAVTRDKPFPIVVVRNGKEMTLNAKLDEDKRRGEGTNFYFKSPRHSGSEHEHEDSGDPT